MAYEIFLDDDSFMEDGIVDDDELLREIRTASWPGDYELQLCQPDPAEDLLFASDGTGVETFDEDAIWGTWIRSRSPQH